MSHDPQQTAQAAGVTPQEHAAGRDRAVRMMVLGAVVAVLAPLGGFLAGTMIGPSRQLGDYDAMFVWMFIGLFVGSIGVVIVLLGLQRWSRATRHLPPTS